MNLRDRQLDLEVNSVTRGLERYYAAQANALDRDREFDCPVGQNFMADTLAEFVPAVRALQTRVRRDFKQALKTGLRLTGCEMEFLALRPEVWAYLTIRVALSGARNTKTVNVAARNLGNVANLEVRWGVLRRMERELAKQETRPNRIEMLKRTVKQIDPRSVRLWLRKLDDVETVMWRHETKLRLGRTMLQLLADTCPDQFDKYQVTNTLRGKVRTMISIRLTEETEAALVSAHKTASEQDPWLLPMLCPPTPWRRTENGSYQGGYLTPTQPLIKRGSMFVHTEGTQYDVPEEVIDALNAVQATGFRINDKVLAVADEALALNSEMLPAPPERELPAEISDAAWKKMTPQEKGAAKNERRMVHDHNNRSYAKRQALRRQLTGAHQFKDEAAIYFPHNLDFRGRMYPIPQDLHPQADDMARGLLEFSEGKHLGNSGLQWLVYYAAATYGLDKESREDQYSWYSMNVGNLCLVAIDPLGDGLSFWRDAEEPWQFLAAAMELEAAFGSGDPTAYISHLPIHVDGTCNGLQHLSAMGRDPAGAYATNLTAEKTRQDIYQIVADKVMDEVAGDCDRDLDNHGEPYRNWEGHVTRKVVKRGVMTTPYGLTDIGMRDQLIEDRMTEGLSGEIMPNANYMRDRMKEAIADTVIAAIEIMEWMQHNARVLAEAGHGVTWVAPTGLEIHQGYYRSASKKIHTLLGVGRAGARFKIQNEQRSMGLLVGKQALAIAPNIVHSFDAAHLQLTVNMAAAKGLTSFSVVHDSYGTHAADMNVLSECLRTAFVDIYEQDWIDSLQRAFEVHAPPSVVEKLRKPPVRGDFDVREVLKSAWFFA